MSQNVESSSSEATPTKSSKTVTLTNSVDEACQPERVTKLVEEAQAFMGNAPPGAFVAANGMIYAPYVPTTNYLHCPCSDTTDGDSQLTCTEPYPNRGWPNSDFWYPDTSSNTFTWTGNSFDVSWMPVSLYIIDHIVSSYVDALDSIEGMEALEGIRNVSMCWKGEDADCDNGLIMERDIGSEPLVRGHVGTTKAFSTLKLGKDISIVAEVTVNDKRMIAVFGNIEVQSLETDISSASGITTPTEELDLNSAIALPWKSADAIIQDVE